MLGHAMLVNMVHLACTFYCVACRSFYRREDWQLRKMLAAHLALRRTHASFATPVTSFTDKNTIHESRTTSEQAVDSMIYARCVCMNMKI